MICLLKYCRQTRYRQSRIQWDEVVHDWAQPQESNIEPGNLVVDQAPSLISILPKDLVAQVIGSSQGKRALHPARTVIVRNLAREEKRLDHRNQFWVTTTRLRAVHRLKLATLTEDIYCGTRADQWTDYRYSYGPALF